MSARDEVLREAAAWLRAKPGPAQGGMREWGAKAVEELVDAERDTEFPSTWAGGHALVIEYGDCELYGRCQCGKPLGMVTPDKPLDRFAGPWERHVMTEVGR